MRGVALRPEALELAEEAWARLVQATPNGVEGLRGELAYRLAAALCWMRGEAGELADFARAARLALELAPPQPDPFRRRWLLALQRAADIESGGDRRAAELDLLHADDLDPAQRIELWALTMGACLTHADLDAYAVADLARFDHGVATDRSAIRVGVGVASGRAATVVRSGELDRAVGADGSAVARVERRFVPAPTMVRPPTTAPYRPKSFSSARSAAGRR